MELKEIRREYLTRGLGREDLDASPIVQFEHWLKQAIDAGIKDPTAMTLATVNEDGMPSQRLVLLKHLDAMGFVFYTNYESQKSLDIAVNPKACLHFPWHGIERQVKVQGRVERVSHAESLRYFLSRPKESQLAAWASRQSQRITSRQFLMSQFESMKSKFSQGDVPLPDYWGGYRVIPSLIEFWQGRENRLHDRFEYRWCDDKWRVERLSP